MILPDNDDPGGKYADSVAAILAKLTPAPVVKVVRIPDLPPGGDLADCIPIGQPFDVDEVRSAIER